MKGTFISHSSKDNVIVEGLISRFSNDKVWCDNWDLDSGDVLIDKIERGIDESRIFLLILSKHSINSRWVKYESNMALCRFLQDEHYRIVVATLDSIEIPTRFSPFKYCECDNRETASDVIYSFLQNIKEDELSTRRRFVNRSKELQTIENAIDDRAIRFIKIVGFLGIGKRSLIKEAALRFYTHPHLVEIQFTSAHFGSRFTLELCSKAGIDIPDDGSDSATLYNHNLLAIDTLLQKGVCILFTGIESILDDDGIPNQDFLTLLEVYKDNPNLVSHPWFLVSTRWPRISCLDPSTVQDLKVDSLETRHLGTIIRYEVELTSPNANVSEEDILLLAEKLHGYPLAGRIAAPILARYGSISYLNDRMGKHVVEEIKTDVAENIISAVDLSDDEKRIVELLALFSYSLDVEAIAFSLELDDDSIIYAIDHLAQYNLVSIDRFGLTLHPLVGDYYYKIGRNHKELVPGLDKLSNLSLERLKASSTEDPDYVHLLSSTTQLLFYSGRYEEARQLRSDLLGELRRAAIDMYYRPDYDLSLVYCEEYLETKPGDKDILYTKARCLSRLGRGEASESILHSLLNGEQNKRSRAKYYRALGRIYMENEPNSASSKKKAEEYLITSINYYEHESAYQSLGDLMYKSGRFPDAEYYLKKKLKISPNDPFALSTYADVLWHIGNKPEAVETISKAIQLSPRTANFYFRAARFLHEQAPPYEPAYQYYKTAVDLDDSFVDAKLSLADVCTDMDKIPEAISILGKIKKESLPKEKSIVFETIEAGVYIKQENIDEAEKKVSHLLSINHSTIVLIRAIQLGLLKYKDLKNKSLFSLAQNELNKASEFVKEGLNGEPDNPALLNYKDRIDGLGHSK